MSSKLDVATNIALLTAASFVCVSLAARHFSDATRPSPESMVVYHSGDVAPSLDGITYGVHSRTVVLFIRSGCRFCTDSMDLYRELAAIRDSRRDIRLVVVTTDDLNTAKAYLSHHRVRADVVANAKLDGLKIRGTPTMLVVNGRGLIENSWTGLIPETKQADVVKLISSGNGY